MRKLIFMCLLALAFIVIPYRASAQGLPVYDNTNFITLGKQIIEAAKQTQNLIKTVEFMKEQKDRIEKVSNVVCLLYTSPSPRDRTRSRMPSSA